MEEKGPAEGMDVDQGSFHLAGELAPAHEQIVRCLGISTTGELLSGSRDQNLTRWLPTPADVAEAMEQTGEDAGLYSVQAIPIQHPHWVNCVTGNQAGEGFVTGYVRCCAAKTWSRLEWAKARAMKRQRWAHAF